MTSLYTSFNTSQNTGREAKVRFKQGTKGALYKKGAKHWCSKRKRIDLNINNVLN